MDSNSPAKDIEALLLDVSDDEETIAEEESLEPEMDPQEELQMLADDLNISLEELTASSESHRPRRIQKKIDYQAMLEELAKKKNKVVVLGQPKSLKDMCSKLVQDLKENNEAGPSNKTLLASTSVSELAKFYLNNTLSSYEDEEADADYRPILRPKFNREIRTGPLYQAEIPEVVAVSSSLDADVQCSDKLLWRPVPDLSEHEVEAFVSEINTIIREALTAEKTRHRAQQRDDEQALEILLRCNFNKQLALNIFKHNLEQALNEVNMKKKKRENNEQGINDSRENMEKKTNDSRENMEKRTNDSRVNVENKTNDLRENIQDETNNEFPSPPKIPKQ